MTLKESIFLNAIHSYDYSYGTLARFYEKAPAEPFHKVPRAGLEPARPFGQQILSLQCLPIPPPRQLKIVNI